MQEQDFPALYQSANSLSLNSQKKFLWTLRSHLILLVFAAILSIISDPHWCVAALQAIALLGALGCSIYLVSKRPERYWYSGRAVAESIKTITWRYVCRAEPFQTEDEIAKSAFKQKLKAIVEQNRDVASGLIDYLGQPQFTSAMAKLRSSCFEDRRKIYAENRITDQLTWYAKKASFNKRQSNYFFAALIATNAVAVLCALLRIKFFSTPYWPTDVFVAIAASLLSWMQARRFTELASSYALAAHEISLIRESSFSTSSDDEFSFFVGDAENAFSREHTQWVARKDA